MASMVDKDKGQNNYNIIEIPKVVKDSLEAMILSSETIKSLAEQSIGMLLQSEKLTKQAETENNENKVDKAESYGFIKYCILSLYTLAIKHHLDGKSLQNLMEAQLKFDAPETKVILRDIYEKYQSELSMKFSIIGGNAVPHVTDIKWRQLTTVKSSSINLNRRQGDSSDGELSFLINMGYFTNANSSSDNLHENEDRRTIAEFVCNTEEMQLLINKLKEIQRFCVKFSNE